VLRRLILVLVFVLPVRGALAHSGAPPGTLDLLPHLESETALSVEAAFGLLLSDDAGTWRWLCHETIARPGAFLTPHYARNTDGVLLATIGVLQQGQDPLESIYRSVDGCDWAPPTGLRELVVTDVVFDPTDPSVALAVTGSVTVGALNGIHRSADAGAAFVPTDVGEVDERIFTSVALSPAGAGDTGTTGWATASWFGPMGAWVYRSTDGGATWQEHAQTLMNGDEQLVQMTIGDVHPTDPLVAWIVVDGQLEDLVMRTDDGGVVFTEVFRADGDISDIHREPDGALWVATIESGLHRAADGTTFVEIEDAPLVSGFSQDARGVHLSLNGDLTTDVVVRSQDGSAFETAMIWDDLVAPLECPKDSDARVFCDSNWEIVEVALGRFEGDDDDSGAGDDDDSAGGEDGCCPDGASLAAAPGAAGGLIPGLIAAWGLRRRRSRSA